MPTEKKQVAQLAVAAILSVSTFTITRYVDRKKAAERIKRQAEADAAQKKAMGQLDDMREVLVDQLETAHFWDIVTRE